MTISIEYQSNMADKNQEKEEKPIVVAKNAAELQKIRLEKLMKNPTKPVHIAERSKDYKPRDPLEFVRNIWGSSAGAGSGDFHVYRGVRRREYARQKFDKEKNEKQDADSEYRQKVMENEKAAEERTAKKRAKRQEYNPLASFRRLSAKLLLKKKQKNKSKKPKKEEKEVSDEEEEEDDEPANKLCDEAGNNAENENGCNAQKVVNSEQSKIKKSDSEVKSGVRNDSSDSGNDSR